MRRALMALAMLLGGVTAASAQGSEGDPSLMQLELNDEGTGYAVILDGEGHEYHCEANVARDTVDLGPCRPLRLVTPLDTQLPALPPMNPAKRSVVDLFERNRCILAYADLKRAIDSLDTRERNAVARMVAVMTERGEIVDDRDRERAHLRIGDRCS